MDRQQFFRYSMTRVHPVFNKLFMLDHNQLYLREILNMMGILTTVCVFDHSGEKKTEFGNVRRLRERFWCVSFSVTPH